MSFLDIVLAVFLAYGVFRGLRNGLFVELASLISFFIGIYIAVKFSYLVATVIVDGTSKTVKVVAFVVTLVLVIIGIHLLAKVFSKIASTLFMGWLNTLGGGFLGALRSVLVLGIVLSLFQKVNFDNALISKETQEKSFFFNPILKTSELFFPVLKNWFEDLKKDS
ncbi:MAG: CvpA family protein [Bacteroidota bacterium]